MSAFPPSQRASRRLRLSAFGLALACSVGIAAPSAALPLAATTGNAVVAPGATDPNKAKKQVDKEIESLKQQLDDTSVALQNTYFALRRTQAALPVAQATLDKATADVSAADAYNDDMAVKLQVAQANEARAVDELSSTRAQLSASRTRVARFASQLYQDQGMGQLSVALSATTPDDFANRIAMNDTVMDVQQQSLQRLATARAAATAQEAHIRALREDVAAAKKAAEAALAKAQDARAKAADAKAKLDALAVQQAAQSKTLEAQKANERKSLDAAQKEQARLQRVLVARAKAAKAAAARRAAALRKAHKRVPSAPRVSAHGFLSAPSDGWISSEFGMRFHPILHYWRLHAGRDYAANCGTPIRAAAPGTVISAGWAGGYGNRIEIDHGILRGVDLVTAYNHMERMVVRSGHVSRGEVIGYVGTTGESTGCHLHFETYEDGIPKDPRRWL
ncbi:peptidoglycan DD-metalloendopeptidase family protein [Phycicoccus sp. 3266]|uniref:peptidoglycan DD-metalloendopeptidase family protein n=1 Tax=Phycicoccus sp. 3266 TaxID=2817751 RepID=UPI00285D0905|nr:peptidoglycan DD-metalloendopeptidase family protein [Phycicoccus sp. 3266]MDR6862087.1 murein DD-endopeptidase MepM/ murein hydrolase activator NlpD [Phycicoccus sp. 3266]